MNNNKDIELVNNDITVFDESIYNNESNDDLNDEDDRIDLKIVCDSGNKEKDINDIYERLLQDKVTDHYLHKYHSKGTPLLFYMILTSKIWKSNYC